MWNCEAVTQYALMLEIVAYGGGSSPKKYRYRSRCVLAKFIMAANWQVPTVWR